jgi:hypothetical protein
MMVAVVSDAAKGRERKVARRITPATSRPGGGGALMDLSRYHAASIARVGTTMRI